MPMVGMPDHAVQAFPMMPVYDDFSQQQQHTPSESARRISRGSCSGYKPNNSMRVVKPSSASNSPQTMASRRRTMMNDGNLARRRQYALDQAILAQQLQSAAPATCDTYQEPVKRTTRPMSWHPSTQVQQQQQPFQMHIQQMPQFDVSQYMLPNTTPSEMDFYSGYQQFPPTPAIYSGQTSPASTFSPLSLPFAASTQPQLPMQPQMESWDTMSYMNSVPMSSSGSPGETEAFPAYTSQSAMEWDAFASNGFHSSTAPPTPDMYQQVDQPEPVLPAEESIPYQALDEPEEEGEILVGMGLYDAPDKTDTDPELDYYRTSTSNLLGSTYRKGAGLKLEEAWEPPKEDESSSDDEEEEEDAEDDS